MPGTDDRLTIRGVGTPLVAFLAVGAVACGVAAVSSRALSLAGMAVILGTQAVTYGRTATVLTPASLSTGTFRRRKVPWGEVAKIRGTLLGAEAVLRDGSAVRLAGVLWRAPRSEGQAPPKSAQAVAEWARAHGHDVPLTAA